MLISSEAKHPYFHLRAPAASWPILATIGLSLLVVVPGGYVFILLTQHTSRTETALPLIAHHAVMLLIAAAPIAWFQQGKLLRVRAGMAQV